MRKPRSLNSLGDVCRGQGREDESLDGAGENAECHDGQRDDEGNQEGEHCDRELIREHISEEPKAQAQRLGEVLEDVDGQQDRGGLHIPCEVAEALLHQSAAEVGEGGEEAQCHSRVDVVRGRSKLARWDFQQLPRDDGAGPVGAEDKEEDRAHEGDPRPVERLSEVVLRNVGGEAEGHLLEVAHAAGRLVLADGCRLGLASHSRADAHRDAGRDEQRRQERRTREGAGRRALYTPRGRHRGAQTSPLRGRNGSKAAPLLLRSACGRPMTHGDKGHGMEAQIERCTEDEEPQCGAGARHGSLPLLRPSGQEMAAWLLSGP
mmetsp:Transcript_73820/g.149864  ORF Transcript_73820/g.149864 Transcript_73820/m.149864 type:complete len:320 (-) Transcript_73820:12-971(-)